MRANQKPHAAAGQDAPAARRKGAPMKRQAKTIFLFSCLCVAALWAAFFFLNARQPVLKNGQALSSTLCGGSRLDGWEKSNEGWSFTVEGANAGQALSLWVSRLVPAPQILCNGLPLTPSPDNPQEYPLPPLPAGKDSLRLSLSDPSCTVYIANRGQLAHWLQRKGQATWATIAAMLVLALYALVLYCCKPSENYMLVFLFYQSLLLLWEVFRIMPDYWQASYPGTVIGRGFTPLVAIASLKYCLRLTERPLPPRLEACLRWSCLPLWAVAAYVISQTVPPLRAISNVLLYLLCLAALSDTAAQRVQGALWLLGGMIFRVGLSPSILLLPFSFISSRESLLFYFLRSVHFIDIPLSLTMMVFVNQKFARQFDESERLARRLDELAEERTKRLKQLQAERQSMVMNITHDLRTPLFVMRSCLDTLEANSDSLPAMLPILKERNAFVSSLTEDLFLLVKLQEGKLILSFQRECLSDVLQKLMASMELEARQKKISLSAGILPDLYVWGDAVRLQQIFQNLISNALHYTPEGGTVSLRMRLDCETPPGFVIVSVRDSGKGISAADAEHIFERYFYTKSDNKHDSSGLGLSIARELTLLHRGEIRVASEAGQGSEFLVRLPLVE